MCKEVYGYVYMVKNLVNGKLYFGITVNDFQRRYDGNIAKNTHNEHLKNSIEKYGIENFEINEEFDVAYNEDDLYDLEDMYMCIYNTTDSRYGYNKRRSGSKHKGHGKQSEEAKQKIGEAHKGKQHSEEAKQKIGEAHKGKQHSEETKRKMSEAQKGNKNPQYGKPLSEEHKRKLSEALKGKMAGKKHPLYGKTHSEETKRKMSEAHKVKVVCLETKQVFDSVKDAQEWLGKGNIKKHLRGNSKYAGKHPITGEKLHWMYYSDYLKLQEEEQQNKTQDLVTEVA